ncbi:hypothetical protein QN379_23045 [Glaciimonas sp. Gout2]|uniref:hypothetical protein n=1 Tax=unclassified Glaciimonas TaxID=2644401 RepID=UPI002AB53366|nr:MULTISPECIES: hypothetical protein [unclassified Glaciimonas]MDY7548904.1 hypothetical protein [Glaciimonas sp. CA11.2]MEB0014521.1 hypothetical protein [Glaciimonas sp. Cout2]MEB0084887.1 hypothetical protein [Glaciimonas sp. Gout2]
MPIASLSEFLQMRIERPKKLASKQAIAEKSDGGKDAIAVPSTISVWLREQATSHHA